MRTGTGHSSKTGPSPGAKLGEKLGAKLGAKSGFNPRHPVAPELPIDDVSAFENGRALLSGMTAWTRQISAYQAAWQQEWWGFVSDRLSKDAAFMRELASCKAADDIAQTYGDFYKQAMEDYQKELVTLAQLSTEMTVAAVPVAPNGHDVLEQRDIDMLGKLNA